MMGINVKRSLIFFSICLNIGFILLGSYYYFKGGTENRWHEGVPKERKYMAFYRKLGLSAGQEVEIKKLLKDYLDEQSRMRTENIDLHKQLIYILAGERKPDKEKLNQILRRIVALKKNREQATVEHLLKVKALLTQEQAKKMFSKILLHCGKEER